MDEFSKAYEGLPSFSEQKLILGLTFGETRYMNHLILKGYMCLRNLQSYRKHKNCLCLVKEATNKYFLPLILKVTLFSLVMTANFKRWTCALYVTVEEYKYSHRLHKFLKMYIILGLGQASFVSQNYRGSRFLNTLAAPAFEKTPLHCLRSTYCSIWPKILQVQRGNLSSSFE